MPQLSRRTVLGAALATTAGAVGLGTSAPLNAQQMQRCSPIPPAGSKGPRVFLDYDQAELDASYDQGPWAPNAGQVSGRIAQHCDMMRRRIGEPRREAYGPTE